MLCCPCCPATSLLIKLSPLSRLPWRARFEVTCYALNRSDGSWWRQAIEQGGEHFVDLSGGCSLGMSGATVASRAGAAARAGAASDDKVVAARMRADGLHVVIDLGGFTSGARPGIFALCPAPVQVLFIMGAVRWEGNAGIGWGHH